MKIVNNFVRKIILGTCFYEVKGFSPYIVSLVATIRALELMKLPWDYKEISGDSYVDRAKNTLLNSFMDDQEATHLFMIDSDHGWHVEGFLRVLRAAMMGAELVGASYPCKNNWDFYGCIPKQEEGEDGNLYYIGKEIGDVRLLEMYCIPGGFVCYSKAALKRTEPNLKTYTVHELCDGGVGRAVTQIEFFKCNIEEDGGRIGEDVYFQKRFSEAGGKIYLEPNATIAHFGIHKWEGNYHEKLIREKEQREAAVKGLTALDQLEGNLKNLESLKEKLEVRECRLKSA